MKKWIKRDINPKTAAQQKKAEEEFIKQESSKAKKIKKTKKQKQE